MNDFQNGPFSFEAGAKVMLNGTPSRRWSMSYDRDVLAERLLPERVTRPEIIECFGSDRAAFVARFQHPVAAHEDPLARGYTARLVRSTDVTGVAGQVLDEFLALTPIEGLRRGMIDDRYATWLHIPEFDGILPMAADEFLRLKTAHEAIRDVLTRGPVIETPAPPLAWVQELLPESALTEDADAWRAPTAWDIRHVVGEGSFTHVTGAQAAAMVGVSAQNFRKYLAAEGAKNQQRISYAMWHLLLHQLGVKAIGSAS